MKAPLALTTFFDYDLQGNLLTNTLPEGSTIIHRYDPYGRLIASSGTLAGANLMRFSSKPGHDHSETYHYGYRFYLPEAQRWLNRDPIGERDGINLYGYVENNPASNIDPLGLILGRLPGFVGDILCPMLSDDSCRICCALAFQAALVADGLEAGTIIGVGVVAGFVTIGAGTGGAVAVALVDSAISHAMNIKGFKSCLESCKDKPDCDKEP